jgi:hypothetical protein
MRRRKWCRRRRGVGRCCSAVCWVVLLGGVPGGAVRRCAGWCCWWLVLVAGGWCCQAAAVGLCCRLGPLGRACGSGRLAPLFRVSPALPATSERSAPLFRLSPYRATEGLSRLSGAECIQAAPEPGVVDDPGQGSRKTVIDSGVNDAGEQLPPRRALFPKSGSVSGCPGHVVFNVHAQVRSAKGMQSVALRSQVLAGGRTRA